MVISPRFAADTPDRKPLRGFYHFKLHYPGYDTMPPEVRDLAVRHKDNLQDALPELVQIAPFIGNQKETPPFIFPENRAMGSLNQLSELLRNHNFHLRFWHFLTQRDPTLITSEVAWAQQWVSCHADSPEALRMDGFFLTGKLAARYYPLQVRKDDAVFKLNQLRSVYDPDARGASKLIPLADELISDDLRERIEAAQQSADRREMKVSRFIEKLRAARPVALIKVVVRDLTAPPDLYFKRPKPEDMEA